jgi:TrmH family RNA methyltransferase
MEFSNSIKKYVRSLHLRKHRQKYDKFIAEGPKVCKEFLICKAYSIEYIFALPEWIDSNKTILGPYSEVIYPVKGKELDQISLLKTPNQVLVVLSTQQQLKGESQWSLFLDRIRDPGNMGTMIRIADWYGITSVMATPDSVDFYNPKVVQGAMGSHNRVALSSFTKESLTTAARPIYGLILGGDNIRDMDSASSGIIAIGNESQGLDPEIISRLDYRCTIPSRGGAESLNAAIACGIACERLIS